MAQPQNGGPAEPAQIEVQGGEWVTIESGDGPPSPEHDRVYTVSFGEESGEGALATLRKYLYRGRRHFDEMVARRQRYARLAMVGVVLLAVALLASAVVIRAAAPESGSTITGSLASRVPVWVYPPGNSAASDAPVITPDPVESSDHHEDDPPLAQLPQGGGGPAATTPPATPRPRVKPRPSPTSLWPDTRRSIRLASSPDRYVRHRDGLVFLDQVTDADPAAARDEATFTVVRGLADGNCYSFRGADGRYLRHYVYQIRYDANDGSPLFGQDATFCARSMSYGGEAVSFESSNYPGRFIRHRRGELFLDTREMSPDFMASIMFQVASPLA